MPKWNEKIVEKLRNSSKNLTRFNLEEQYIFWKTIEKSCGIVVEKFFPPQSGAIFYQYLAWKTEKLNLLC